MTTDDTRRRIHFGDLHRFSDLFRTYCDDYTSLSEFFAGDFRQIDSFEKVAVEAAGFDRDRETLVSVLRRQNEHWGARENTLRNITRLLDPEAVAVVTGQQVGLLTGPLYTILKTITAVQLARDLEARTGRPCIPVFWLEGEDHDVAEATSVHLPSDGGPVRCTYVPTQNGDGVNAGPVGRLRVDDRFGQFLSQVEEALPATDFRDAVLEAARDSYETGETLLCGFARYLRRLFPDEGLVFLSADDPDLKSLLKPLFRRELEDCAGSFSALSTATQRIESRYSAQIRPKEGNLFILDALGRLRLDPSEHSFHLRGVDRDYSRSALLDMLDDDPSKFSPNVVLRPLAQDTLLPTAVYVAGPGEIAYFAQLKGLYDWAGIPMPIVYPRVSATFVETRIQRVLDRYSLDVTTLAGDVNDIIREAVLSTFDIDIDVVFGETEHSVSEAMARLRPLIEQIDVSLGKTVDATRSGIVKQIEGLKGRTVRSARRQQDQLGEAIQRAAHQLFPDGHLQERMMSPLYLMSKYGTDLPVRWIAELSTDTTAHQVIEMSGFSS